MQFWARFYIKPKSVPNDVRSVKFRINTVFPVPGQWSSKWRGREGGRESLMKSTCRQFLFLVRKRFFSGLAPCLFFFSFLPWHGFLHPQPALLKSLRLPGIKSHGRCKHVISASVAPRPDVSRTRISFQSPWWDPDILPQNGRLLVSPGHSFSWHLSLFLSLSHTHTHTHPHTCILTLEAFKNHCSDISAALCWVFLLSLPCYTGSSRKKSHSPLLNSTLSWTKWIPQKCFKILAIWISLFSFQSFFFLFL